MPMKQSVTVRSAPSDSSAVNGAGRLRGKFECKRFAPAT